MQSDILYAHNDELDDVNVLDVVSWVPQGSGDWHGEHGSATHSGLPVLEWDTDKAEDRQFRHIRTILEHSSGTSIPAEVLPGEIICGDGVIRRLASLKEPEQAKGYQGHKVTIAEALKAQAEGAMVVWRPKGSKDKFAIILEEGN